MNHSHLLGPHLPYLRRYARALTGSQVSGDTYVRASLEALVDKEATLPEDPSPKVALFRLFHTIWWSVAQGRRATPLTAAGPEGRLQSLTPLSRVALLLSAVERFTRAEIARILETTETAVQEHLLQAQREIERLLASRVLIIEDEIIIALDLKELVTQLGHEVIGIAATQQEAVDLAGRHPPGLVLADVRLADGTNGIAAVEEILKHTDVPVVFITAYPEALLTGTRPEPTYLISKPFLPETVMATISQALFFHQGVQAAT